MYFEVLRNKMTCITFTEVIPIETKKKRHKLLSVSTSDYNEVRRTKSKHSENLMKYMGG